MYVELDGNYRNEEIAFLWEQRTSREKTERKSPLSLLGDTRETLACHIVVDAIQ